MRLRNWTFTNRVDAARQERLAAWPSFDSIAMRIVREAIVTHCDVCRGKHESVKGALRPRFQLCVDADLGDAFFNAPQGYRAGYYVDPRLGEERNESLIASIFTRLAVFAAENAAKIALEAGLLRASLRFPSAKVWISEERFAFDHEWHPDLSVPEWIASGKSAADSFQQEMSPQPALAEKAIWGVRAPVESVLNVFGAFVTLAGDERVPADKLGRSQEIHDFGFA